jgi:hypothetical protein
LETIYIYKVGRYKVRISNGLYYKEIYIKDTHKIFSRYKHVLTYTYNEEIHLNLNDVDIVRELYADI